MGERKLKRRDIEVSAVFDIETENWDTFVVGGLYTADGWYKDYDWNGESGLVDALLSIDGCVWAHAGGIFDFKWLLDHISARGLNAQIVSAGSRVVSVTCGTLRLFDSFALCPIKLKDFTSGQGVSKEELQLPCKCGDDCGGYCSISRSMSSTDFKRVRDYLYADCKSLYEALQSLRVYAEANDLDLGPTIGSSAWRNAKRHLELENADMDTQEHDYCRAAYYGGRVQLYRPGLSERVYEYDVNSMYPWTLSTFELPTGNRTFDYGAGAKSAFLKSRPGIYRAVIDVPKMHLPPLPFRYKAGTKTAYPTGTFSGSYALPELLHAIDRGSSCKIIDCLTFQSSRVIFTSWIDRLFDLRFNAPNGGKKGPLGTFLKFYMNSLTGKFGSNPERDKFTINPEYIKVCHVSRPCRDGGKQDCGFCCEIHCSGKCGSHFQLSDRVFYEKSYRIDGCSHIEWSTYLTSHARIALNKQQISVNEGYDVVYGDTDSIYSLLPRSTFTGKGLGEWDIGGEHKNFVGIAPKCYYYTSADGKLVRKAKGIRLPKRATVIEPGRRYVDNAGIIGFRAGARGGKFFSKKEVSRLLTNQPGDRVSVGNGETRAPDAAELPA